MTEKRFTLKPYDEIRCDVFDGEIEIAEVHRDDAKGLIDLLNDLAEENEQLQSEIDECNRIKTKRTERMKNQRKALNDMQEALWGYKGDIKSLKKENEELKKEIEELKWNLELER